MLAPGDGAGALGGVSCSTWVTAETPADTQALHPSQILTLGLTMGLQTHSAEVPPRDLSGPDPGVAGKCHRVRWVGERGLAGSWGQSRL